MRRGHIIEKHGITASFGQTACLCLLAVAQNAIANPTGGSVAAGNASISNSGATTTIIQTSNKAIINWQDFSINNNEITEFKQPTSSSVTLNRVTGGNASQIMGSLKANGNIYLINPNGILFGKNAHVDVGGLVASTSQITDKEFLNNNAQKHFTPGNNPNASIINEGHISIKNAGLAVLVSPNVVNNGVIEANLGTVAIASADHFTIDPYGDRLIEFDAGPIQTNGKAVNAGIIKANGGTVIMTAQAADHMVENIVNMNGYIQATSVSTKNGKVVLQGYDNSQVNVAGTIDVSGTGQNQTGGVIQASADHIRLLANSVLNASGSDGGGTVNIGGGYQGKGTLRHAQTTTMDAGALINANAINTGNGGQAVLWSDQNTQVHGSITAQGGAISGNGGLVETSSHDNLDISNAYVRANAVHGNAGLWYLDPTDLTVSDADAANYNTTLATITNVSINADNNITFDNTTTPISWSTNASFTATADFDQSGVGTIIFNPGAAINSSAGAINLYYSAAQPTETAIDFSPYVSVSGTGALNAYMKVSKAASATLDSTEAGFINAALATTSNPVGGGTNVVIMGAGDLTLGSALGINWSSAKSLTINAVNSILFGVNGAVTDIITLSNASATLNLRGDSSGTNAGANGVSSGATVDTTFNNARVNSLGAVNIFYNPLTFGTALSYATLMSAGTSTNYMLVHDTTAGRLLSNLSASLSGSYALSQDLSTGLGAFTPLNTFTGKLTGINNTTGTNYNITGLTTSGSGNRAIFRITSGGAVLSNLTITNPSITGTGNNTAVLVASASNTTIANITVNNPTVINNAGFQPLIGGIIGGTGDHLTLSNLVVNGGTISSTSTNSEIGGIICELEQNTGTTTFTGVNSNSATLTANNGAVVGGVIGVLYDNMTLTGDFINTGTLSGNLVVGGIIADIQSNNTLSGNLINRGNVSVVGSGNNYGGGIIAYNVSGTNNQFSGQFTNSGSVSGSDYIGGLFGYMNAPGALPNVYSGTFTNNGLVSGDNGIGGIVGVSYTNATFSGSLTNNAAVSGAGVVGGILGSGVNGTVTGTMINNGTINADGSSATAVGGIYGNSDSVTITSSAILTNHGTVYGSDSTGGIVGNLLGGGGSGPAYAGTFTNYGDVNPITAAGTGVGGLIGAGSGAFLTGTFTLASGTVQGISDVGGVIGNISNNGASNGAISSAAILSTLAGTVVKGTGSVGGILGSAASSTLNGSYFNSANVDPADNVGGIAGLVSASTLSGNYELVAGSIIGNNNVGGLFGQITSTSTVDTTATMLTDAGTYVEGASNIGGLIGLMDSSTIYNPTATFINAAEVTTTGTPAINTIGGIFGSMGSSMTITNSLENDGYIHDTAATGIGGITGTTTTDNFQKSLTNTGHIVGGPTYTGGLIGIDNASTFGTTGADVDSNSGQIDGQDYVGGLIGLGGNSMVFNASLQNSGNVTGVATSTGSVGGIGGRFFTFSTPIQFNSTVTNSGTIQNNLFGTGGLFGTLTRASFAAAISSTGGTVTGNSEVGGLIGLAQLITFNGSLTYSGGDVFGNSAVGGLIGESTANTFQGSLSHQNGNVTGTGVGSFGVGGLIGYENGSDNFTSTSSLNFSVPNATTLTVSGSQDVGGLFGYFSDSNVSLSATSLSTSVIGTGVMNVTGDIPFNGVNIGGLIGVVDSQGGMAVSNPGNMTNVANVSGGFTIGGVFGEILSPNFVNNNTTANFGSVTAGALAGGIVGQINGGSLPGTYQNYGNVTIAGGGSPDEGGIAGVVNNSALTGSYELMTGVQVTSFSANTGGLFGAVGGGSTIDVGAQMTTDAGTFVQGAGVVGGLIGLMDSSVTFTNIFALPVSSYSVFTNNAEVTIFTPTAVNTVGGIFGSVDPGLSGPILNALTNNGYVHNSAATAIGGIIGSALAIGFSNDLTNTGQISGASNVGGLIGSDNQSTFGTSSLNTASNSGAISGASNVGGLIGHEVSTPTINSAMVNTGDVTGSGSAVGGVFGLIDNFNFTDSSPVTNAANVTITGTGQQYLGGIVGDMQGGGFTGLITLGDGSVNTYALTMASGGTGLGGVAGRMRGPNTTLVLDNITINSNMTFAPTASSDIGGVVGQLAATFASPSLSGTFTTNPITIPSGNQNVGAVIGHMTNVSTFAGAITNATNLIASGNNSVAGVIGLLDSGTFSSALENQGNITGNDKVGGIFGYSGGGFTFNGTVTNSGTITGNGTQAAGGIGGWAQNGSSTFNQDATNSGDVTATNANYVGGIIGNNFSGGVFFTNFINTGSITGLDYVGGDVGQAFAIFNFVGNNGALSTVTNTKPIIGRNYVGGNYGYMDTQNLNDFVTTNSGSVTGTSGGFAVGGNAGFAISPFGGSTYAGTFNNTGDVSAPGSSYVGGIFAYAQGTTITGALNSTAGVVTGNGIVGGLIGYSDSSISNTATLTFTRSAATVIGQGGASDVGGLIGYADLDMNFAPASITMTGPVTVQGGDTVGGMIGFINGTGSATYTIPNTINTFTVQNTGSYTGGFFGQITGTPTISGDLTNNGSVSGFNYLGGIFGACDGCNFSSGTLTNNVIVSSVGSGFIGGIGGQILNPGGTIAATLINNGNVSGVNATNVGGIFGQILGSSFSDTASVTNTGTVIGDQYVGGIVGDMEGGTFTGPITVGDLAGNLVLTLSNGKTGLGGFAGRMTGGSNIDVGNITLNLNATPANTFNTSGSTGVGGVVGFVDGLGTNTYLTGTFTSSPLIINGGNSDVGAIIGEMNGVSGFGNFGTQLINTANLTTDSLQAGGVAGLITGSYSAGALINAGVIQGSTGDTGGVAGQATISSFNILVNAGNVSGTGPTGGIFGEISSSALSGFTATQNANITGVNNVGGLIGQSDGNMSYNSGASLSYTADTNTYTVSGTGNNVGGLIGYLSDSGLSFDPGSLSTSVTSGGVINISGFFSAGGLIGLLDAVGTISSSNPGSMSNVANVSGVWYEGGAFGQIASTGFSTSNSITNSGTIGGGQNVGGIAGLATQANFGGNLTNSGQINELFAGVNNIGGLVGFDQGSTFGTTSSDLAQNSGFINVGSGANNVGGLIGAEFASGNFNANLLNTGTVTGNTVVGGVLGYTNSASTFGGSITNTGSVSGTGSGYLGGVFGEVAGGGTFNGAISNSGNVTGSGLAQYVGGVGGYMQSGPILNFNSTVTNSGNVSGQGLTGGLIGIITNAIFGGALSSTAGTVQGASTVGGLIGVAGNSSFNSTASYTGGTITGTGNFVGGLLGDSSNNIYNGALSVSNTNISGTGNGVGGLIGISSGTDTFNSSSSLLYTANTNAYTISGANNVGGLIGEADSTNSFASSSLSTSTVGGGTINVTGGADVGGLIGYANINTFTGNLSASGNTVVNGNTNVGGLVGYARNDSFTGINTFSGSVTGNFDTGGVVGLMNNSTLMHAGLNGASGHGTVTGNTNTGGIAGELSNNSTINQAYNISNNTVSGLVDVTGGIAGTIDGGSSILNVLFGGTLNAAGTSAGGIVGVNNGTITNALSAGTFGTVTATFAGTLVGTNNGTLTNYIGTGQPDSFYDTRNYPGFGAVGTGNAGGTGTADPIALFGPTMYTTQGWDFATIWNTSTGNYPVLRFCPSCSVPLAGAPIPPTPTPTPTISPAILASIYNAIQTQTVNALNTFDLDQESILANAIWEAMTGLNILPAATVLNSMDFSGSGSAFQSAMNFINNTVVLEWLDNNQVDLQSPAGTEVYVVTALQQTVKALQGAQSCPVK